MEDTKTFPLRKKRRRKFEGKQVSRIMRLARGIIRNNITRSSFLLLACTLKKVKDIDTVRGKREKRSPKNYLLMCVQYSLCNYAAVIRHAVIINIYSFMYFVVVSPAYGFSALALVKCSNEGGPGPRHNM